MEKENAELILKTIEELLTNEFIARNTKFQSLEEMLKQAAKEQGACYIPK